jgi:predicted naringenin-chalcone synthase
MPDDGPDEGPSGLRVLALAEELVADSTDDMRWTITEWGFRMTLTQEVPQKIGATLPAFLASLFAQADFDYKIRVR